MQPEETIAERLINNNETVRPVIIHRFRRRKPAKGGQLVDEDGQVTTIVLVKVLKIVSVGGGAVTGGDK